MVLDLHTALMLRNSSQGRIRGVTLQVLAQEVTPGGKGSVSVASIDVGPGEAFPVRIDLRLLRPLHAGSSPLVEIGLDGVLFEDLTFYGPNKLNSRRSMLAWEMEARRDRRYMRAILEKEGPHALQREIVESLARLDARPQLDVRVARSGRVTNVAAERRLEFAFLDMPGSPIGASGGTAVVAGSELRSPRLSLSNTTREPIKYAEIGWVVRDRSGSSFFAGAVPAELNLAPGQSKIVEQNASLRLSRPTGGMLDIESMRAFVSQVEFANGKVWVPARDAYRASRLQSVVAPSAEEQRLLELYRKKGLAAVVDELKRLN
jgi:hypothetical protein